MPQDMPPVGGYGPVQYKDFTTRVLFGRRPLHYPKPTTSIPIRRECPQSREQLGDRKDESWAKRDYDTGLWSEANGHFQQRNLPASGFRPATLLVGMGAVMVYGFYKLGQGIKEQNELAREKMWSRIHLIPLLQAEEDRDLVRRHLADQAREKELMGENFKVYNSDRYVRPTYAVTPTNTTK
ncbi:Uu.00g135090.m01.CDS01 [Anthostomella pinea]|uniref:NADH dehydrogenase [ubiquinone] 1 alpha subcomplex subunit 13 n=1 Tax=Anthostomella pinea TaxID=933095 RepID=A0AAI8VPQ5_9PEZI|nr:Uu.00g135090.m01.CDS01 [Anthostomella pinea]